MSNEDIIKFARENFLNRCRVVFVSNEELVSKLTYLGGDETLTEIGFGITETQRFIAKEIKTIEVAL